MLYLQHTITLGIFSLLTWGCGNSDKQKGEAEQAPLADKVWYSNPVIDSDNPDPTVIKAEDGYFYLYATGGNTWIHKSKDLVHWTYVGGAYEDDKNRHGNRKQVFGRRISIISMEICDVLLLVQVGRWSNLWYWCFCFGQAGRTVYRSRQIIP